MARLWEVRGLFGNEYAMEGAVEEIKKLEDVRYRVLDRRNLQVLLGHDDEEKKALVKNIIKIAKGHIDGDAPLGELDRQREKHRLEKLKEYEEKKKRAPKH